MSTALVPFQELQGMAAAVAKSGLFGMKTVEQATALMLVAQAEGQHPATITQDYDIIQGKATRKTHSVLARFQAMGGTVEWHQLTDAIADATFKHKAGGALRMTWTLEQAKKAGLVGKDNWKNYPRAMLRARCIAEGVRAVYPAALGGMLVSEEAQDLTAPEKAIDPATGEINQATQTRPEPQSYPQEALDANLDAWRKVIESGRKTPDQIIVMASTMGVLSEAQKQQIRNLAPIEAEATAVDSAQPPEEVDDPFVRDMA